jgi:7-carboxy-7-deazaguanine synthase
MKRTLQSIAKINNMKRIEDYSKVLPITELYKAVQSEGSRAGYPTVVVRTTGCTHRCFVNVPGRHNPKVYGVDGKVIDLREVKVGDRLMAWNPETLSITETEVVGTETNQVQTYYQVKTENGTFVVTPEHPFMTTRGWMFAKDLTEVDELVHFSGRQRNSYRMQNFNPMKDSRVAQKVHAHPNYSNFSDDRHRERSYKTRKDKYGTLNPRAAWTDDQVKDFHTRASTRMQEDNPMYNPDILSSSIAKRKNLGWGFKGGKSKVEEEFWNWLQESDLKDLFWFTGDGSFSVKYNGTVKVPDFKLHGSNYFLEVGIETGPKGFRPEWNRYVKEVNDVYANCHLEDAKVLAVNVNDGKEECLRKVRRFVSNGIKVIEVKPVTSKKVYSTYNLHCAPFDNFLVRTSDSSHQSVVSHNCFFGEGGWCDSWYTSIHPEKGKYTFNDIIKMYGENPHITEMMLTGGSPTMHSALVNELTIFAAKYGITITIETEGSHFVPTEYPIGLLSISPKFSNSVPVLGVKTPQGVETTQQMINTHNRLRLNYQAIAQSIVYHDNFHIKPVIDAELTIMQEVDEFLEKLAEALRTLEMDGNSFRELTQQELVIYLRERTWLMPAGDTREALIKSYGPVMDYARDSGYKFTGRPHVIAFNDQREV